MSWLLPSAYGETNSRTGECIKAAKIIDSFINPLIVGDGGIPRKILGSAKVGRHSAFANLKSFDSAKLTSCQVLIICTVFRVSFFGSIRFGSGIMVSRLPDGSWSAPSAVALGGIGIGVSFGTELTDFVFVMSTDEAVARVIHTPSISLGLNVSLAIGLGRSAESGGMLGMRGMSGFYSFSKTRGIYAGISGEGSLICENPHANKKIYERKLKARQLVGGEIPFPREAELLMQVLNSDIMKAQGSSTASGGTNRHASKLPDEFYQAPKPFAESERPTSNGSSAAYREARDITQDPVELHSDTVCRELTTGSTRRELPTEPSQVYELGPTHSQDSGNQTPATPSNRV